MASPHLPHPAARQAGPATRARPQPVRRPRWSGRLLVLVLTVVLVAAVGTRASADSADDAPLPEWAGKAAGTGTDAGAGTGIDLGQPRTETAAQQPAVATDGDGGAHVVTVGILPAPDQGGDGEALPQLPSVVAEARPEPAGGQTAASRQPPDRPDQDEPGAGTGGCAGGCSNEPPTPAGPTAAAADDPVSRFVARLLQAAGTGRRPAQQPAPERPPQDPPQQPEPEPEPAQRPELT